MRNAEKWPKILQKSCTGNTAKIFKMFGHFLILCMKGFTL